MELTMNQILNMSERLEGSVDYSYNQHTGIGGKAQISPGNKSLERIPLRIKLHFSFCNPEKAINLVKDYADNNKEIEWFQSGKYIGTYVIASINKQIEQMHRDAIVFAQLDIELLESPQEGNEFEPTETEQLKNVQTAKPSLVEQIKTTALKMVRDSVFTVLSTASLSDLSNLGNMVAAELKQNIINEVELKGITSIYDSTAEAVKKIPLYNELTDDEKTAIQSFLEEIPNSMIDAAL